jgi:ABC-type antimicrobial peptide transport system permease subunit
MLAGCMVRRRWRRVAALALLVGVVGAVVLSSAAGARRSSTALARFNRATRSADLQILVGSLGLPTPMQLAAMARVQGVDAFAALHVFAVVVPRAPNLSAIAAATDSKFASVVDRARFVAGRAANPSAVNEITIGESLAAQAHLRVGDSLEEVSYTLAQIRASFTTNGNPQGAPAGPRLALRIVGITRRPLDLGDRGANGGVLVETPAFYRTYVRRIGGYGTVFRIRTHNGSPDYPRIVAQTKRIFPNAIFVNVSPLGVENNGAQDAINVLTAALWVFAAVVAIAGAVTVALILGREASLANVDDATLRALGLTRLQRTALVACPSLVIAGASALVATLGAVLASPLFPLGVAGRADPNRGVQYDWQVLLLGFAAIIAVVVSIGIVTGYLSVRRSMLDLEDGRRRRRPSRVVEVASAIGLGLSVTNGLRMALEPGRGRTAVPVRSAVVGAVIGILGVSAVLTFAASVQHLATTPRLYGWTADYAAADNNNTGTTCGRRDYGLTHTPGITAVAAVCTSPIQLDGRTVTGFGFEPLRGNIEPEVIQGRAPSRPDEIALGTTTLNALHKKIGDEVTAVGPHTTHVYRIVGRVVVPELGSVQPLADSATLTDPGLEHVLDPTTASRYLLISFAVHTNRNPIEQRIATNSALASPTGPTVPPEINRLRHINWFPVTIAIILASLALAAVGHALITGVRRRSRDLAVLKTLGFTRHQLRATVAWQATTNAALGLIIGIPTGIALGHLLWTQVADNLGVPPTTTLPIGAILLTIPAVLLLVNMLAFPPARRAARTQPAIAFRTE